MRFGVGASSSSVYDLLGQAGNAVLAVVQTVERRIHEWPSGPSQEEVKALEHEADRHASELLVAANTLFVTPFDRDDLVDLTFKIDDVADAAENASELFSLYGIETPTKHAFQLAELLVRSTEHLAALLGDMQSKRGSAEEILRIKELEDEADDVERAARASLFRDERIDPVIVIRWKDIYEAIEDAIDACDIAAHRVGNILVKNA